MDLYEYQAKHLFGKHGVPVFPGEVCTTPDAAHEASRKIGAPVVVKAQVKTGGRGKAGGVKLANDPDEAAARAQDILRGTHPDLVQHHPSATIPAEMPAASAAQ